MAVNKRVLITIVVLAVLALPVTAFAEAAQPQAQRHFQKGHQYYLEAEADKAEAEFRKALELNPGLSEAHYYLGSLYFKQDRYAQAREECEAALEINPQDLKSLIILGLCVHHLGLDEESVKVFQRAVEVDQQSPAAHSGLGLAYCSIGDLEKAREQYYILRELAPDLADDLLPRIKELEK